ncbi:ClbS/DfsB family four-helix bundle protein [Achromobacter pestifer]|uniref:ClbS/DfsB family four-helix bundle protein n=1 Tax=Achromobacter pestifer TaxID=1353889 RepID=UPI0015813EEE|nr:ClbS/DfsB family four-helix bundle protein [Achromobacter pestifer]
MKLTTSRQELLRNIRARHRRFRVELATVPPSVRRVFPEKARRENADASMVMIDVILWNTMILQMANDPTPPVFFYQVDPMLRRAEHLSPVFQRRFAGTCHHELAQLTASGQERLLDCVARHSNTTLFDPSVRSFETLGRRIQCFTSMAYAEAFSRLRHWKLIMELVRASNSRCSGRPAAR